MFTDNTENLGKRPHARRTQRRLLCLFPPCLRASVV